MFAFYEDRNNWNRQDKVIGYVLVPAFAVFITFNVWVIGAILGA